MNENPCPQCGGSTLPPSSFAPEGDHFCYSCPLWFKPVAEEDAAHDLEVKLLHFGF